MGKIKDFLIRVFSWNNVLVDVSTTGLIRALMWILGIEIDGVREIGYWIVVPVLLMVVLGYRSLLVRGPQLKGAIIMSVVGAIDASTSVVAATVQIYNAGDGASAALGWRVWVVLAGETERRILALSFGDLTVTDEVQGQELAMKDADLIYKKTIRALSPGDAVEGFVKSIAKGLRLEDLQRPGTRIGISFIDVRGKRTEFEQTISADRASLSLPAGLPSGSLGEVKPKPEE